MSQPRLPNRYEVRALLGEGGSGRVFHVHDSIRERDLALKLVTAAASAFLRREFDTLRQIRHENLVEVLDWGSLPSGDAYYTMELIEGEDWSRRMGDSRGESVVRQILAGVLRGVAHLHCHGQIHGDLKPANILIARGGIVKVTDVGMGGGGVGQHHVSGTPGYAAPEIWEGKLPTERSDLYAVGVMAYEALTGRHPFDGKTIRDVVAGQMEGWVPSPAVHGVRLAPDLERAVMRALERHPGLRQATADEFMEGIGVKERVGAILGGRFAGREELLESAVSLLQGALGPRESLLNVTGPPGSGRATFLKELMCEATRLDMQVLSIQAASSLEDVLRARPGDPSRRTARVSSIVASLRSRAGNRPLLVLYPDVTSSKDTLSQVRDVARFVWALRLENPASSPILMALATGPAEGPSEPFERLLQLLPLDVAGISALAEGFLGRTAFRDTELSAIFAETGGNPAAVTALLSELVRGEVLTRNAGIWEIAAPDRIKKIRLPKSANLWKVRVGSLDPGSLRVLATVALPRDGLPTSLLRVTVDEATVDRLMPRLLAHGWTTERGGRWFIPSKAARDAILNHLGKSTVTAVARSLLQSGSTILEADCLLDLKILAGPGTESAVDVLRMARAALASGKRDSAIRWLEALRAAGSNAISDEILAELDSLLADALEQDGRYEESEAILRPYASARDRMSGAVAVRVLTTLARIRRQQGAYTEAREHLLGAKQFANDAGLQGAELPITAQLAEVDFEFGDEHVRRQGIESVRARVDEAFRHSPISDDIVALAYSLGAARVRMGEYSEANIGLREALARCETPYWKMRITNALAAAQAYLGQHEGALEWLDESWRWAELGGTETFLPKILSNRGSILHRMGRYREAAEADLRAANWARRLGSTIEFITGCSGTAINSLILAEYERAIQLGQEAEVGGEGVAKGRYVARAIEVQALAHYYIGDLSEADRDLERAREAYAGQEYVDLGPRLDWLAARIAAGKGNVGVALATLRQVERALLEKTDPEDLLGVQVEVHLLGVKRENSAQTSRALYEVAQAANRAGLLLPEVSALSGLGEVLSRFAIDDLQFREILQRGLMRAEEAGVLEIVWQLSHWLSVLAVRSGDLRSAGTRRAHSLRVLRAIAGSLTEEHRQTYLSSGRVRHLLESIDR